MYFIIIITFTIGIIVGSITIKVLNSQQKSDIMLFLNSFFKAIASKNFDKMAILKRSLLDNLKTVGLIWITGIILIGIPIIPITILFRGFALGFSVGFLVNEYGIKGLMFSVLGVLPQNLFIIPGIISVASIGMGFSFNNIKKRRLKIKNSSILIDIVDYSILVALCSIIIIIGCFIEAYISPIFLGLLSDYL